MSDRQLSKTATNLWRIQGESVAGAPDLLATEEPLEVRLRWGADAGRTVAITMRTPGADAELAAGFLFTEGILASRDEIAGFSGGTGAPPADGAVGAVGAVGAAGAGSGAVGAAGGGEAVGAAGGGEALGAGGGGEALGAAGGGDEVAVRGGGEVVARSTTAGPGAAAGAALPCNVVEVAIRGARAPELASLERHFFTTSACGVCGKASLEALTPRLPAALPAGPRVTPALLRSLPAKLRGSQGLFDATGGLHAAALFDARGDLVAVREDVGRHNALDKLIGWALLAGRLPLHDHVLMVSGRTSYEILQKSAVAGLALVCSVSAPSSLAVDLARRFGVTLVGFLRGDRCNVYSGIERIATAAGVAAGLPVTVPAQGPGAAAPKERFAVLGRHGAARPPRQRPEPRKEL